jgi:hypothetical protein
VVPSPDAGDFLAITIRTERCEQTAAKNSELLKIPIASAAQIQLSPQAPGVGHGRPLGHIGKSPDADAPEWAANVESCFATWACPQVGQLTSGSSAARRISFSNRAPQSSHLYSNIGIQLSILVNQG